ncbi:MAG: hypothetical protein ACRD2Z_00845, partial [Thermoanaerobaculia bacterium]
MKKGTTYVGLDVHKKDIVVAMLAPGVQAAATWKLANEPRAVRRLARKLKRETAGEVRSAYEAVRDLCRCREDVRQDLTRCRHRLGKFLLRRGLRYLDGRAWTQRHRQWLWRLELEHPAAQATLESYLLGIEQLEAQLGELNASIAEIADSAPYREQVGWLRCFRGIERRQGQAAEVIALADRAMRRLHRRHWRLLSLGKPPQKAVTATARELVGFL